MKKKIVHIGFSKTLCGLNLNHVNSCVGPEQKPLTALVEMLRYEERLCLNCLKVKRAIDKSLKSIKKEKRS